MVSNELKSDMKKLLNIILVIFSYNAPAKEFSEQLNVTLVGSNLSQISHSQTKHPQTSQVQFSKNKTKEKNMSAKGQFEVSLTPQNDELSAGRMLIDKTYTGDLTGTGIGQMISKRTETGAAVYYAIEEFSGKLNGKSGAFTFIHSGAMDKNSQSLEVTILAGSGKGELSDISGTLQIIQENGNHSYVLEYEL